MDQSNEIFSALFSEKVDHFIFTTLSESTSDHFYVANIFRDRIEIDDQTHDHNDFHVFHFSDADSNIDADEPGAAMWLANVSRDLGSDQFLPMHVSLRDTVQNLPDSLGVLVSRSDLNIHFLNEEELTAISGGIAVGGLSFLQSPILQSISQAGKKIQASVSSAIKKIFGKSAPANSQQITSVQHKLKDEALRQTSSQDSASSAPADTMTQVNDAQLRQSINMSHVQAPTSIDDVKKAATSAIDNGTDYSISKFSDLKRLMSATKRSTHTQKTQRFLSIYNQQVAPKLTSETDALEYMAIKTAYLRLGEGDEVAMNIKTKASSTRDISYGSRYRVMKRAVDTEKKTGMVAYMMTPLNADGQEDMKANPILLYRGTAAGMDAIAKEEGHGKGVKADLDRRGIGYDSFEANHNDIMPWVQEQFASSPNRNVSVIGHSLGGALAERTMCYLPSDLQARTHVTTFQAPGIDQETASQFDHTHASNIVHVMTSNDIVTRAGEEHLPTGDGQILSLRGSITGLKDNHLGTPGTKHALDKKGIKEREAVPIEKFKPKPIFESLRRFFGRKYGHKAPI